MARIVLKISGEYSIGGEKLVVDSVTNQIVH